MPGHVSPDGTVMVRRDARPEEDSKFSKFIIVLSYILVVITFPICGWFCFKVVKEYERAVIFRLGGWRRANRAQVA